MKRNAQRMLVALLISASSFAGFKIWFERGKGALDFENRAPVARLNDSTNEVQRKPLKRVIWENISKNDELFPGEAVRTSSDAEAHILVTKNGTSIHLEPGSLIVLEESDKGLSLDFLQGNMMVAGGSGDLTVKTGSGEIKMNSADLSLSKDKAGEVSLEVLKGQAELSQGNQKVALDKNKAATLSEKGVAVAKERLQILEPRSSEPVLLNLLKGEKGIVKWQALPKGYNVTVDLGPSRSQFNRLGIATATGETGTAAFTTKPGKWYMRVSAEATDEKLPKLASVIVPFTVQPKSPPSLVEPAEKAALFKKDPKDPIGFSWMNRHDYASQVLEVSGDPQFKDIKFKQDLTGKDRAASASLPDGTYFWRVTGFLKVADKVEGIASPSRAFSVSSNWIVQPPTLTNPPNQQRLSFLDVQKANGVTMKWQLPSGVQRFHLTVLKQTDAGTKTVLDQSSESPVAKLADPTPGTYLWKVASVDPKDNSEKVSETFEYTIDELPPIEWVETNLNHEYEFTTPTPSLAAQWQPLAVPPASYRYRVVAEGQSIQDGKWQTTKLTTFEIPLPAEGAYQASVEAINAKGQAIAGSEVRTFHIHSRPLLPAPKWADNTPETIKSDAKGNLNLGWQPVDGAKNYTLILQSDEGQIVEQRSVSRTTASFSKLKPGQYQVKVKSIDGHQRPGPDSEPRTVTVPNMSDIRAPKIKTMKVK